MLKFDFPIFKTRPYLVYFDSAATTLKPYPVIQAVANWYENCGAPVHRAVYPLAETSTASFEHARGVIARFFGAQPTNLILSANATASLNQVANGLNQSGWLSSDSVILILEGEHHSNYLPWLKLGENKEVSLVFVRLNERGEVDLQNLTSLLDQHKNKIKLFALSQANNVLGSLHDIQAISKLVKQKSPDALVLVDASQSAPHLPLQVVQSGADFMIMGGHKLYGPNGVGILWGNTDALSKLSPTVLGGNMVSSVKKDQITLNELPHRLEAGSPNIEGVIGLSSALSYLENINMNKVTEHTESITLALLEGLKEIPEILIIGNPNPKVGIISFTHTHLHPHDIATLLGEKDICIRAGQQCSGPLHESLNIPASCRISVGIYNDSDDVTRIIDALKTLKCSL